MVMVWAKVKFRQNPTKMTINNANFFNIQSFSVNPYKIKQCDFLIHLNLIGLKNSGINININTFPVKYNFNLYFEQSPGLNVNYDWKELIWDLSRANLSKVQSLHTNLKTKTSSN